MGVPGTQETARRACPRLPFVNGERAARRAATVLVAAAIGSGLVVTVHAQTPLDRAYRIIAGRQFVDLTHSFGPDTPVWSGFTRALTL